MYTSISMRSANTYRSVGLETSVTGASPHQLIELLFVALHQSLAAAKGAILSQDVATKLRAISQTIRILEEGLKAGLDVKKGGELAANLSSLYDYCILRTTEANLRNDATLIDEVIRLIHPISDGWKQIRGQVNVQTYQS